MWRLASKQQPMKITNLLVAAVVSAGLAFGVTGQAKEKKHEEETVSSADVPAAAQKTAEKEAKGGKIVRWEKEGADYEAVIDKTGKQWGVKIDRSEERRVGKE